MGRIKKTCTEPGCQNAQVSIGKRGGKPYYSSKCVRHRHPEYYQKHHDAYVQKKKAHKLERNIESHDPAGA